MLDVTLIILPIFLTILVGYLLLRFHILEKEHIKVLGLFLIKVALPCLLLVNISAQDFSQLIQVPFLVSYSLASLVVFSLALIIYLRKFNYPLNEAGVMGMGAAMSNTGFIGSGLLYLFLGERAAIYFGMAFLIENFIIFFLFLICLELSKKNTHLLKMLQSALVNILKNPIVIALILGFFLSAMQIPLPEALIKVFKPIGQISAPLGLLVIGGSLYGTSIGAQKHLAQDACILLGLKLILMPVLVYGIFQFFPSASDEMIFAGTLLASVSMVGIFAIFAQQLNMQKAPPILLITTLMSIFSLSIVIHYLKF